MNDRKKFQEVIRLLEYYSGRDKLFHGLGIVPHGQGPMFNSPEYVNYFLALRLIKWLGRRLSNVRKDRRSNSQMVFDWYDQR